MVDPVVLAGWLLNTRRQPLPPGDPVSWSVLTEDTLLEGSPWGEAPPKPAARSEISR